MKYSILACFLLIFFLKAPGQRIVSPGKVWFGDKVVSGFIAVTASEKTPQQFGFSETKNGNILDITEQAVRIEFQSGELYERYFVRIDQIGKPYFSRQKTDYSGSSFEGRRWLQNIVTGFVSLYLMYDDAKYPQFFYRDSTQTEVTKLLYRPYTDEPNLFFDDPEYKMQIRELFKLRNCGSGERETKYLSYEIHALKKVFLEMNTCSGALASDHFSKPNKLAIQTNVSAGLFSYYVNPSDRDIKWKRAVVPLIGASLLLQPAGGRKGFGFGGEVLFTKISTKTDTSVNLGGLEYDGKYEATELNVKLFIQHYFSQGSPRLYAAAGVNIPVSFTSELSYTSSTTSGKTSAVYNIPFTPFLAAGINFKSLSAEGVYGTNLSKYRSLNYFGVIFRYRVF